MAITKTDFINYSRCPRYVALDEIKKERLEAMVDIDEYKKREYDEEIAEMLTMMYETNEEGEEIDLVEVENKQLKAMLQYYNQVEIEAGKLVEKHFGGRTVYAKETFQQELFDFNRHGIKYMCYIDIYNEQTDRINIVEVKATTTKKYLHNTFGKRGEEKELLYLKKDGIYYLRDEFEASLLNNEEYLNSKNKLYDRFGLGQYLYDLAVQRFFIEGEYQAANNSHINQIHYYLGTLNHNYIYDGYCEDGHPVYRTDENGEDLICFFDYTKITKEMQSRIAQDADLIERYIEKLQRKEVDLGKYCCFKKTNVCKFFKPLCGQKIPQSNSSLNYLNLVGGFKNDQGEKLKSLDLINAGYLKMEDIPEHWLKNPNHLIQRNALITNQAYLDKEKIRTLLNTIEYPIYHLDFETFPCPLPRYKGEWPYIQSPFEFSLHIESAPGVCDKDKDNYVFLANSHEDVREDMIKLMLKYMDGNKGTLLAQNVPFEKGRIKELATIFPQYKQELMKLYDRGFDLLWLLRGKKDLFINLGFDQSKAERVNYYHPALSGSYSIKKTLPLFSDLSYKNLIVHNGTEAIVEYANYPLLSKEEFELKYQALIEYCKQDTWAMVEILNGLRRLVK